MKRIALLISIMIGIVLMVGTVVSPQNMDELIGTQWQLVSINSEAVVEGSTVTLNFDKENSAGGSGGCNSYGTSYTIEGNSISFSMISSTMMACLEEDVMEQEVAYLAALQGATSFEIIDNQLVITSSEGETLVYEPMVTLAGSGWQLETIAGEDALGTVTLVFGEDDTVSGNSGCNMFNTTYSVEQSALSFEPFLSTKMACVDAELTQQEIAYFAALEAADSYELSADQLTIVYGDGETLVFKPMPMLENTSWMLEVSGETEITLNFDDKGRAFGSGGCNEYSTSYTVEGDSLTFETVERTERACLDEGVMSEEQAFFAALESATGYTLMDETLTLTYGEGDRLLFSAVTP
jgi:heat shock protein HslJ